MVRIVVLEQVQIELLLFLFEIAIHFVITLYHSFLTLYDYSHFTIPHITTPPFSPGPSREQLLFELREKLAVVGAAKGGSSLGTLR